MRLLLVVPRLVSYRAFLRELCLGLLAEGHEVHIACSREKLWVGDATAEEDGVQMHAVEFPRGMNPLAHRRAARALDQLVRELQPDFVHAHFSAAIFTTALAVSPDWPPAFATFHGVSFLAMSGWKAAVLRFAESWGARRFDRVWVLTNDDRNGLRKTAPGVQVDRLSGFGMGCDLEAFTPLSPKAREERRRELGFSSENVVFAFVGRFVAFKGFAATVRAFLALAKSHQNVRLLLIGAADRLHQSGLAPDEEAALQNSPHVVDLGFREDVPHCLAAADVMVFPSRREGMPVSLMESLAMGIPAVTCDTRGCREVVRDSIDGFVLRNDETQALRDAMERLTDSPELRRKMGEQALAGRERFSREEFVRIQKGIYESLARGAEEGRLVSA